MKPNNNAWGDTIAALESCYSIFVAIHDRLPYLSRTLLQLVAVKDVAYELTGRGVERTVAAAIRHVVKVDLLLVDHRRAVLPRLRCPPAQGFLPENNRADPQENPKRA